MLGLRLEDLSYGQRRVTVRKRDEHPRQVRQKSRRDRVVDLLEGRALPALNDYMMHERPADAGCPWVFLVGGKGGPLKPFSALGPTGRNTDLELSCVNISRRLQASTPSHQTRPEVRLRIRVYD